jgi:UPF0042 nucleotide-binding protein
VTPASAPDPDPGAATPTESETPETPGIEVVVISGLSGAGRSTAARCLEDLGWFVVDNLPAELIGTMVDLGARTGGAVNRMAVVLDVRARVFTADLAGVIKSLDALGYRPRVLYLDASDAALIRRYEANRRAHPLQGEGRLVDGLAAERALLGPLRHEADLVIDTSELSVHELRDRITDAFPQVKPTSSMTILSFGFKYGLPLDADLVIDMRFLPNPYWDPDLRPLNGTDHPVSEYVLSRPGAREFVDRYVDLLDLIGDGFEREGKRYVTLAVGCTGGKHRSVAVAEEIGRRLAGQGRSVTVVHRDLGRE